MEREAPNLSTSYQPKGSGLNPSDTLDRADTTKDKVAAPTSAGPAKPGGRVVIDERGRPLSGDGQVEESDADA